MIDFRGYTAKAIEQAMLNQVPEGMDTREGSMIQTAIGPAAWFLEGIYLLLAQIQNNAYADTAAGEALDRKVMERGLTRRSATPAIRRGIFNVPVLSGSEFKTINGADSVIFVSGEQISAAEDQYIYKMTCKIPGRIGNYYAGNLLPITSVPGLTSAVLGELVTAGAEEENDVALRTRFFETFTIAEFGGNIQSYRNAILGIAGVGAVQVYPAWKGGGTVLCSILDDQFQPALPALVEQVQAIICPLEEEETSPSVHGYGMAPIGAAVTITTAKALTLNISCTVEVVSGIQNGAESYQDEIEKKIEEYLDSVNRSWGNPIKGHSIDYSITVYLSRIIFAILTIEQIANVTDVRINGSGQDLHLVETADLQQIPALGMVVIQDG